MFEKEAKEYVNEEYDFCYYPEDNLSTRINAERDWQRGAEFGYNKAFVEADKNLKAIVADFNKAKELIKEMLSILPKENIEGIYEITEEAEEFIREVEEWKK